MTVVTKVRHHWALSVFTLFFLPLTLVLGVWQLDRAQQKDELALSLAALEQALHKSPADSLTALVDYQRVTLNAQFIKPYVWFRDNQVVKGKVGYDAIGVVAVGPELLLVNRGWFASNGQRNPLPNIDWLEGDITLTGRLVPKTANPYQLAADVYTNDYPQLVQALDLPQLQQQFELPLLPWVLMLDAPSPALLTPHWQASSMSSAKHLGYAWQWFGLALTLCLLYIYRVFYSSLR